MKYLGLIILLFLISAVQAQVTLSEEELILPTYKMGPDEKHAIFKDYRYPGTVVFRGDRSVYPYTLQENFTHKKQNIAYQAIRLENEYLQTWIIPELRGRLQGAIDKRNGWDFIYFNEVIKPADISIRKAWLAGGLEWNHPGGHGYTQLEKLSYITREYPDGSKSVIVTEVEPVRQMKWQTEIKLHPNKLFVETTCKLISIAPYPVPFTSSLNGAMHTSEELEVIYPSGSHFTGHGKKTMWPWPLFDGKTDARWFKNLKRTFSVFVEGQGLKEDFWGCYSHDDSIDAGTVIVADHRFAPGKKYFTWGSHDKGRIWDSLLSDQNGGYIELQVQAFWDNLGYGYAWLHPLEIKHFSVFWYPIKNMGGFVKATKDICLNIQQKNDNKLQIALQATRLIRNARIVLFDTRTNHILYEKMSNLTPEGPWKDEFKLSKEIDYNSLLVTVYDEIDNQLIRYETKPRNYETPELPAKLNKVERQSLDQLFAMGKSFYQDPFSAEAEKFYLEMLEKDSLESRANRELGLIHYFRGNYRKAKSYLQQSLKNDALNFAHPTYFYLALSVFEEGNLTQAKDYLAVAGRNREYQALATYWQGKIALKEKRYDQAKIYLQEAIEAGAKHPDLFNYLALSCRKLNQSGQTKRAISNAFQLDPISFPALWEKYFSSDSSSQMMKEIYRLFDRETETFTGSQLYLESAIFYMQIAAWQEAIAILETGIKYFKQNRKEVYPLLLYYLGYCYLHIDKPLEASYHYKIAAEKDPHYVFPYHRYSVKVLEAVTQSQPLDANGWLYRGNLMAYYRRHPEAINAWQKSLKINENNIFALHNLAGALWHTTKDTIETIALLEKALNKASTDQRIIFELDHLYQAFKMSEKRYELFSNHELIVKKMDELIIRYVRFCLETQDFDKAIELMEQTQFFPKEINYEKPYYHTLFAEAHFGKAEFFIGKGNYTAALKHVERGMTYPPNLCDIWPAKPVNNRAYYLKGLIYEGMQQISDAKTVLNKIINSPSREGSESEYYKALAYKKLEKPVLASNKFKSLINYNSKILQSSLNSTEKAISLYLLGISYDQLNNRAQAITHLDEAFQLKSDVVLDARIEATYIPRTAF